MHIKNPFRTCSAFACVNSPCLPAHIADRRESMLTQEQIDREAPVPAKLGTGASAEDKAARKELMDKRRKLMEKLRQQDREPQRSRPASGDASTQRAVQRALKAQALALAAVDSAVVPLTPEAEVPLHKILDQAEAHLNKLDDLPCADEERRWAACQLNRAILVLAWKLYSSMKLQPIIESLPPFPSPHESINHDNVIKFHEELMSLLDPHLFEPMCAAVLDNADVYYETFLDERAPSARAM